MKTDKVRTVNNMNVTLFNFGLSWEKNCSSDRWTFQLKAHFLSPHPSLPLLWKKVSSATLYFLGAEYLSYTILFLVWQQDFNFSRLHVLHVAELFWIMCTYNSHKCCIVGNWTSFSFLKTFHPTSKRLLQVKHFQETETHPVVYDTAFELPWAGWLRTFINMCTYSLMLKKEED